MSKKKITHNNNFRILAEGYYQNNNTRITGLNNNDAVIGPSGSSKTRGYVIPNILQANESVIVADTKGNLIDQVGPALQKSGYRLLQIDFKSMHSTCRWNPLDAVAYNEETGMYSEQDIIKIAKVLTPVENRGEPFWDNASGQYLTMLIAYVMDFLPEEEHNMESVLRLFRLMDSDTFGTMMQETCTYYPDCTAAKYYDQIKRNRTADRTHASIMCVLSEHLQCVVLDSAIAMYQHPETFRFGDLAEEKTALFVNISDTDRSLDPLVSLFYTQALQGLCDYADKNCADSRFPIPVRFLLDDFATNIRIDDFDRVISVIRSREIYVSIILQDIDQLYALYGQDRGNTILNNCDHILFLGGQSIAGATYAATRANLPMHAVLNMPLDRSYLFTRGKEAEIVRKFDLKTHERYGELPEASAGRSSRRPKSPAGAGSAAQEQPDDTSRKM